MKLLNKVLGVLLVFILGMTSCKQNTEVASPTVAPTEVTESPDNEYSFDETSLKKLSAEYTNKILDGKIEDLYDILTEENKKGLTEKGLKDAYEKVINPLGNYLGVKSVETKSDTDHIYVMTLLEYENNGLLVTYGYTPQLALSTLYFSYQPIVKPIAEDEEFIEQEIKIGSTELKMDGLLTLPKAVKNPPLIILIQGSGQSDMDETIGAAGNKPLRDLAHGLAKQGVATIRYNKRYYQYPEQASDNLTVEDEILDDAAAAISYAVACDSIDQTQIYLAGHSLGGMLAPKIAMDNNKIRGIIVLAGSPRRLEDIIYDQVEAKVLMDDKLTEEEKEAYLESTRGSILQIKELEETGLNDTILGAKGYYWRSLNQIDTPKILLELTIPMLFLQGDADFQVSPLKDFGAFKELLTDHSNVTFHQYANLNHLFMETNGVNGVEDYDTKGCVDQQVITDIKDWLLENNQ